MRSSGSFYRPAAVAFAVAVAAGGALLPIAGVSSAGPLAGTFPVTHFTVVNVTSAALTTIPASAVAQGAPLTLIAAVTPASAIGSVQFRDGTTDIGIPDTVTDGAASVTTSTSMLAVGPHQLTAVFTPADPVAYGPSRSPAVSLTVTVAGSEGGESLQEITPQAQRSDQSLDELNVLDGGSRPGDAVPGDLVPGDVASPTPQKLPDGPLGIPGVMLEAYQRAAQTMADTQPACHLSWTTLAGIGKMESGHASGGRVDSAGNTLDPILGPPLNGSPGMAAVADTDQGMLDADPGGDRAVGPMQFIPSSWRAYGIGNPNNIYDSTLAAGRYLCAGGADLSDPAQQAVAVYRYNHSGPYVTAVLRWAVGYQTGVMPTPSAPESVPPATDGNGALSALAAGAPQTPVVVQPPPQVVAKLDAPVPNLDVPTVANLDAPVVLLPATPLSDSLTSVPLE